MDRKTIDATTDAAIAHERETGHETIRIYGGLGIYCPECHASKVGLSTWRALGTVIKEQKPV